MKTNLRIKGINLIGKTAMIKKTIMSRYAGTNGTISDVQESNLGERFLVAFGSEMLFFFRHEFTVKRSPAKPDWRKTQINDLTIETWWDRYSRNWITEVKDSNGFEVQDKDENFIPADYSGYKSAAQFAHRAMVEMITKTADEIIRLHVPAELQSQIGKLAQVGPHIYLPNMAAPITSAPQQVKNQEPIPFGIGVNGMGVAVDCHTCQHVSYPASTDNVLEYTCPNCGSFAWGTDEVSHLIPPAKPTYKTDDRVITNSGRPATITGISVTYGQANKYHLTFDHEGIPDDKPYTADDICLIGANSPVNDHQTQTNGIVQWACNYLNGPALNSGKHINDNGDWTDDTPVTNDHQLSHIVDMYD